MALREILIIGATGQQGGALVEALLSRKANFSIYGLTRNAASPSAIKLAERGVEMIQGDVTDPNPIFAKIGSGVWGVFSVTISGKTEEAQAKPLIDAAVQNDVCHFIFTSVDRGGRIKSDQDPTYVPHFITKFNVEKHLIEKASKSSQQMMWTILRPTIFMDNFVPAFTGKLTARIISNTGEVRVQLVRLKDIGQVAARAFEDPEAFKMRSITLAGDSLNFKELNEIFKEEVGHDAPVAPGLLVTVALFFNGDFRKMAQWMTEGGYSGGLDEIEKETPGLMDFRTWLKTESVWLKGGTQPSEMSISGRIVR